MILDVFASLARAAALSLAIACAAGAVLALGGAFSDRLDVFTHFAPLYLAGGLGALLVHLASRPERGGLTMLLAVVAFLAAGLLMAPEVVAALSARRSLPGAETIKLVQFNLWGRNRDPVGTARWILKQDADIVVLEEAYDNTMVIPGLLAHHYPHRTTCSPPFLCSTMILSKAAPAAAGGLQERRNEIETYGAWARFGEEGTGFTVFGVHYTWPIPAGPQQNQTRFVAGLLKGFDRPNLIVAGDFNSTPWSFSLRRQDRLFGLERRTHALFSWPAAAISRYRLQFPFPFLAIDHVYAGSAWRTVDVHRGPRLGSDHFPVVVTLTRGEVRPAR